MSRAKGRTKGNIPTWFELKDYDYLANASMSEWSNILWVLVHVITWTRQEVEAWYTESLEAARPGEVIGSYEDWLSSLIRDLLTEAPSDYAFARRASQFRHISEQFRFGGVGSLDTGMVANMACSLLQMSHGKNLLDFIQKNRASGGRSASGLSRNLRHFSSRPFFVNYLQEIEVRNSDADSAQIPSLRAVAVDMRLPDDALRESFSRWLSEIRKVEPWRSAPRSIRPSDCQEWHSDRYVPLLVLGKWSELVGTKITRSEMLSALFPGGEMVDPDRLRKTIEPNAKAWCCWESYHAVMAKAAEEHKNGKGRADLEV